jgi:hypothetical protein
MRTLACLLGVTLLALFQGCASISVFGDSEAKNAARQIWAERFGECGDSFFAHYKITGASYDLYQYKNAEIEVQEQSVSEADKLNGVEWKGITHLKPQAYRSWDSLSKKWTAWRNGVPLMGPSLGLAERFERVRGHWAYNHFSFYAKIECSEIPQ